MENKDKLLKNFFSEQKIEIVDNGFSQNVSRKLPSTNNKNWIVAIFTAVGLLISLWLGFQTGFILRVIEDIQNLPFVYIIVALFFFPLITAPAFFLSKRAKQWF
jgi:hypothetical protein